MVISPRVSLHAYARPWGRLRVSVWAYGLRARMWRGRKAEHAEPRSVVSTRLERLNRSTSLLLYTLCVLPPEPERRTNEHLPSRPLRTPILFLSISFSFSSGFRPRVSVYLSRSLSLSRRRTIDQPSHANARFKNARLSAMYARTSSVFLFP